MNTFTLLRPCHILHRTSLDVGWVGENHPAVNLAANLVDFGIINMGRSRIEACDGCNELVVPSCTVKFENSL